MSETPNVDVVFDPAETDRIGDEAFTGPSVAQVMGAGLGEVQGSTGLPSLTHAEVLALEVPKANELVEGVIEAGTVGTIASLPELHKSFLAAEITHKLAAGGQVLGRLKIAKQGPVGFWWQDDSTENEVRRIQTYARVHEHTGELPIRWHLNEGLRLPDDIPRLREEVEREGQLLAFLDSLYNFLPGRTLKDEDVAAVYAAIKQEVCDQTGATVAVVDHAPWPTDSNRGQRRAYGTVFKAAAVRWGIYLEAQADTLYVEARGNNLAGLKRTPVVWDPDKLELRLVEPRTIEDELVDRIDDFLSRNPGAATTVVQKGVKGNEGAIKRTLADDERFVTVPPVLFGRPRNAVCWARVADAPGLFDGTEPNGGEQ